jgi:hypothetical protein
MGTCREDFLGGFLQLMEQINSRAPSKLSQVLLETLQLRNTY